MPEQFPAIQSSSLAVRQARWIFCSEQFARGQIGPVAEQIFNYNTCACPHFEASEMNHVGADLAPRSRLLKSFGERG
jgi:hypothetical protein